MENIIRVQEEESIKRIISIFKKVSPTKEEMLLAIGAAYMAGRDKGKEPVKN